MKLPAFILTATLLVAVTVACGGIEPDHNDDGRDSAIVVPPVDSSAIIEHDRKTQEYEAALRSVITRARIPSINLTFVTPTDSFSVFAVNDAFYATAAKQEVQPININSIYQACSISKIPLTMLAMKMVEEGRLSLDKPLYDYYPGITEYFDGNDNKAKAKLLTARMCLSHRSGLNNTDYSKIKFVNNPGSAYKYSGPGMFMLQRTVETIEGATLDVLARERIFAPLGMDHTSYKWENEYEQTHLYGFRSSGTQRNTNWAGGKCNAAYSMRTNSVEYTRFLRAVLNHWYLSDATYELMFTKQGSYLSASYSDREKKNIYRTLGWAVEYNAEFGPIYYHTGNNVSFKGMSMIIPEKGISLVYFINGDHSYNIHDSILHLFLDNKEPFSLVSKATKLPE